VADVHNAWHILWAAWLAVSICYLVLYLVGSGRLRGQQKKRSGNIFWVIAALVAIRLLIRFALGDGLIYRLAALFVGIAAGTAALDLARMLITQRPDDRTADAGGSEERIHSLRLN